MLSLAVSRVCTNLSGVFCSGKCSVRMLVVARESRKAHAVSQLSPKLPQKKPSVGGAAEAVCWAVESMAEARERIAKARYRSSSQVTYTVETRNRTVLFMSAAQTPVPTDDACDAFQQGVKLKSL